MATKLEAVNRILLHLQMRPVQTLEEPLNPVVAQAKLVLEQEARALQRKGWEYNREDNREFQPDVDNGFITFPTTILAVGFDGTRRHQSRLTVRGGRLYNAADRTYVFTEVMSFNVLVALDFDDLSEVSQEVAMWRSAREMYLAAGKGDQKQLASIAQKERESYAEMMRRDTMNTDARISDSPLIARTITRRNDWTWVT